MRPTGPVHESRQRTALKEYVLRPTHLESSSCLLHTEHLPPQLRCAAVRSRPGTLSRPRCLALLVQLAAEGVHRNWLGRALSASLLLAAAGQGCAAVASTRRCCGEQAQLGGQLVALGCEEC